MDFRLNEDQISLQKAAREFLSKECSIEVVREAFEGPNGDAPELYKKMADLGWLALAVPEEHGGVGLDLVDQSVLVEQLGYFNAPGTFFSNAAIAIPLLLRANAFDELPAILDGSRRVSTVIDERFVLDGQLADAFLVVAEGELRIVEAAQVEVTPHETVDGTRRTASVSVPAGTGRSLGPASAVSSVIDSAAALLCAESTGGMQRVLDDTVAYSKERTQFGRPVGSFQAIKHRLADVLVKTESARSASYYASWANQAGAKDAALATSVAKAYVSDAAMWVTGQGVQLHGGIGFTWEHHAHLFFKRAITNATLLGDVDYHRQRVLKLTY